MFKLMDKIFLFNFTFFLYLDLYMKSIISTSKNIHTYYALTVMVLEISQYYIRDHLKLYLGQHKRFWYLSHRFVTRVQTIPAQIS